MGLFSKTRRRTSRVRIERRVAAVAVAVATMAAGAGIANAAAYYGPGYRVLVPSGWEAEDVGPVGKDGAGEYVYCLDMAKTFNSHVPKDGAWETKTDPNWRIAARMVADNNNDSSDLTQAAVAYAIHDHLDEEPNAPHGWNSVKGRYGLSDGGNWGAISAKADQLWNTASANTPSSVQVKKSAGLANGVQVVDIKNGSGGYVSGIPWRISVTGPVKIDGSMSGTTTNGPINIRWHALSTGSATVKVEYNRTVARRLAEAANIQPIVTHDPGEFWTPENIQFKVSPQYKLDVTTSQKTGSIRPGSTNPVHDTLHVKAEPSAMDAAFDPASVNASVTLHFDGNTATGPQSSTKQATLKGAVMDWAKTGSDFESPDFAPKDLGMSGWQSGSYWFSVHADKQGQMSAPVDTSDHVESEEAALADKCWVLDKKGALTTSDPTGSNKTGADNLTFLPGDPVTAVVTGHLPTGQASPLKSYAITDDWGDAAKYVDFANDAGNPNHAVSVYRGGKDVTDQFDIPVDAARHAPTATAKPAFLASTAHATRDSQQVRLIITGTFRSDYKTNGGKQTLSNAGSQQWNGHGAQTNVPSVFSWTPNPNKEWAKNTKADGTGSWVLDSDPGKTDKAGGDARNYRDGDPLAGVVNGTVPTGLALAPRIALTDDYSHAAYMWSPSDLSKVRVYEQDLPSSDDAPDANIDGIDRTGRDATADYTISGDASKHTITATIKAAHAEELVRLTTPRQITLLVPGEVNFAGSHSNLKVQEDYGLTTIRHQRFTDKTGAHWYETCTNPSKTSSLVSSQDAGKPFLNAGSQGAGSVTVPSNEPPFCVIKPEAPKTVVAEKSQGGDRHDADTQLVRPNQRIEYRLDPSDRITGDDGYTVESVAIRDQYSAHATVDPQTIEATDADNDDLVAGKDYTVDVDNASHVFVLTLSKSYIAANYRPGETVQLHIRFEARLDDLKGLEPSQSVDNRYEYRVNNATTVSNTVSNKYVPPTPKKADTQHGSTVDINGKRLLLGDVYDYRLALDATNLTNGTSTKNPDGSIGRSGRQVYRVQRLGMRDAYDHEHLSLDAKAVKVLDASGRDVTGKFNVQIEDGVLRVYAKTVDTKRPDTGAIVKGDPQPTLCLHPYRVCSVKPLTFIQSSQSDMSPAHSLGVGIGFGPGFAHMIFTPAPRVLRFEWQKPYPVKVLCGLSNPAR